MLKYALWCYVYVAVNANIYQPNSTDLTKCKVHYSRSGSVYKDFYSISESPGQNYTYLLDFHFAVLAPSDAHILLAPSESVEKTDPAYEIVIGAGGNTFCDIRRKQKSEVKASVRINGLLSALDPHFFWLHITKDGSIEVGKEGAELPFISWIDPDPLPLKVISFSTWSGIEAKWYFDCERKNETQEIQKPLTYHEKLRKDLLSRYDPYSRPVKNVSTITTVSMAMQINHIDLDEHRSTIELLGMSKLAWHDEKLRWNPEDYADMETLHIFRREIWQPELTLYNAIEGGSDILKDSMMVAHSTGLVEWNPSMHLKAWCDAEDLGRWPRDKHRCSLELGFMRDFDCIRLEFSKNESSLIYQEYSKWSILQGDVFSDKPTNETNERPIFQIVLVLERSSNFYNTVFFTPFLIISISVLLTFWMDPLGKMKISLSCCQLVLSTVILLGLALFAPNHSQHVPYLIILYSFTMLAIVIAALIAVIVINLSRNKQKNSLPHLLCSIVTAKAVRVGLCLPKMNVSDEYGKLNDVANLKSQEKQQMMWILLGIMIDRIAFVIYLGFTIYAIYSFQ